MSVLAQPPAAPREPAARIALLERARRGEEPVEVVEAALADGEHTVRERAAQIASGLVAPERLVGMLGQPKSPALRAAAMEALARAGVCALPALLQGVESGDKATALFCLQVLGRIQSSLACRALREAVGHKDPLLAQAAIEALGVQRDAEAVPLLLKAIDADPWRSFAAVVALGCIGDPRAEGPLQRLCTDEVLKDVALEALATLRERRRHG